MREVNNNIHLNLQIGLNDNLFDIILENDDTLYENCENTNTFSKLAISYQIKKTQVNHN